MWPYIWVTAKYIRGRSFKLQQKQALERDKSQTTSMNNKNELTTNGNNNSYHTIQVNHYHDEIDLTKDEILQRRPQKIIFTLH
ncbi:hypothetical protein BUZ03_06605 [Staphylococcus gallinarum]|nr:hypothetical protein BUZ03_06605 [Staphylococcus gallinarum]